MIDRLAYRCHPPRRWDLIAFRSHDAPDYLEVKRVVGLPGERISIRQGDVYADGRLARKTLPQLRAAAVLVHDSGFEPRHTVACRLVGERRPTAAGRGLQKPFLPFDA